MAGLPSPMHISLSMSEWALPTQNFIDTNISKEKLYLQPTAVCVCVYIDKATAAVQLPSHVQLFVTLWTAAHQASLSLPISRSLPKFMSIESGMASNHLILHKSSICIDSNPSLNIFMNSFWSHLDPLWLLLFSVGSILLPVPGHVPPGILLPKATETICEHLGWCVSCM